MSRENLLMIAGTERTFIVNLADADDQLPELAGATAYLIVEDEFRKTVTIDESAGDGSVTVEPADTESVTFRRTRPYNVRVEEDDGTVKVTQRGRFTILPAVTHPEE